MVHHLVPPCEWSTEGLTPLMTNFWTPKLRFSNRMRPVTTSLEVGPTSMGTITMRNTTLEDRIVAINLAVDPTYSHASGRLDVRYI